MMYVALPAVSSVVAVGVLCVGTLGTEGVVLGTVSGGGLGFFSLLENAPVAARTTPTITSSATTAPTMIRTRRRPPPPPPGGGAPGPGPAPRGGGAPGTGPAARRGAGVGDPSADLQRRLADLDDVPGRKPGRALDLLAVDERAVGRAEVGDVEPTLVRARNLGVAPRDLRVALEGAEALGRPANDE